MTTITTAQLTTKVVGGNGVFDELMDAVSAHLKVQFKAGRITGTDYSRVYSEAMVAVLGQSIQFLLQKEVSGNQADLIAQQLINTTTEELNIVKQGLNLDEQRAVITKSLILNGQLDKDVLATVAKINQTDAQTTLLGTENTKSGSENSLIIAQELKVDAEKLVVDTQLLSIVQATLTEVEKTALAVLQKAEVSASTLNIQEKTLGAAFTRTSILPAQSTKLTNEGALVIQKTQSEKGVTSNTLIDGTTPVAGTSGAQKALYAKQTEGYDRNNEYKIAKLYGDIFNVGVGSNDGRTSATAGVDDAQIKIVLDQARSNVSL